MPEIVYTARLTGPYLLEQGRSQTIQIPLYVGTALAAPTALGSTCMVADAAGRAVSTGAVTVEGSIATYVVAALDTSTAQLGDGWVVTWTLVLPDGSTRQFREVAALCRVVPSPAASLVDLYRRAPALDPSREPISAVDSWQPQLDEAWATIQDVLVSKGKRPWLIVGSTDLRQVHLTLALALCYEALASRNNTAYLDMAKMYRAEYTDAWSAVTLSYSTGDSGQVDARRNAGALWAGSRRTSTRYGWGF